MGVGTAKRRRLVFAFLRLIGIAKKKSLKIAAELPLFRYASRRLFRLRELVAMIASMKHTMVSAKERAKILKYYKQGINVSQIGPLLWVDFGMARRDSTIRKVINDAGLS